MAEEKKDAATGLDAAAVQKLVADGVAAAIKPLQDALAESQKNQKVLADTLAADAKAKEAATKAQSDEAAKGKDAAKPLTAEEVAKLVKDSLAGELTAREQAAKSSAERDKFVGEKLKGVPAVYHGKLGADPKNWEAEAAAVRDAYKADLTAAGATVKDVNGDAGGGQAAAGAAKTPANANLTPGQAKFAAGLKMADGSSLPS